MKNILLYLYILIIMINCQEKIQQKNDSEEKSGAFWRSFSTILVSEVGDKTFFVSMIMAMKYNKVVVFVASIASLIIMTVLSCSFGSILPLILSRKFSDVLAMILFFVFGGKLLYDASKVQNDGQAMQEELEEVQEEINKLDEQLLPNKNEGVEMQQQSKYQNQFEQQKNVMDKEASDQQFKLNKFVFMQTFSMVFFGEWGDRSQIATIALSASYNPVLVCLGGIIGHGVCTLGAVICGSFLNGKLSEKYILISGGVLFILFGIHIATEL